MAVMELRLPRGVSARQLWMFWFQSWCRASLETVASKAGHCVVVLIQRLTWAKDEKMPHLSDFATLAQLGFALNIALPALFLIYERVEGNIASALAELAKANSPQMNIDRADVLVLTRIASTVKSLKPLRYFKWGAIACSLFALALSLAGLLGAAIHPTVDLKRSWIWLFSLYAVVICPGGTMVYGLLAANKGREIIRSLQRSDEGKKFVEDLPERIDSGRATHEVEEFLISIRKTGKENAHLHFRELGGRWYEWYFPKLLERRKRREIEKSMKFIREFSDQVQRFAKQVEDRRSATQP